MSIIAVNEPRLEPKKLVFEKAHLVIRAVGAVSSPSQGKVLVTKSWGNINIFPRNDKQL